MSHQLPSNGKEEQGRNRGMERVVHGSRNSRCHRRPMSIFQRFVNPPPLPPDARCAERRFEPVCIYHRISIYRSPLANLFESDLIDEARPHDVLLGEIDNRARWQTLATNRRVRRAEERLVIYSHNPAGQYLPASVGGDKDGVSNDQLKANTEIIGRSFHYRMIVVTWVQLHNQLIRQSSV